jgi:hypothetical protein
MSFWENLAASTGIGACGLSVTLEAPVVGWSEEAKGLVHVTGGRVRQEIARLDASLVQHWTTMTMVGKTPVVRHHYHSHDQATLASGFWVEPGEQRDFPFSLTAPWGGQFAHHWFIGARAGIGGAVDRGARGDFRLGPPAVFTRVAAVLTQVSRLPVSSWSLLGAGGARAELRPREESLSEILDGVRLELTLSGDWIGGQVVVNPQERSAADVLQSLVRADRRSLPIRFQRDDLDAARAAFEEALRPDLDALRQLPIPSAADASTEGLPRPAEAPPER